MSVLCNTRFPSTAAHGTYLARLCESLSGRGVSVELVVPKRFREVQVDPLTYYSVKTPFAVRKIWSFDFIILGPLLRRLAFPLQYGNFYLFVLFFFLFRSRRRIIYTTDNLGCLLTFLGYRVVFETHIGIGPYRGYLLPLLRRASRFVVLNSIIKKDFVSAGFRADSILVAPNGVDLSVFAGSESKEELRANLHLSQDTKIIAYIGKYKTMGMAKGVDELVGAFGSLYSIRKDVHLLIVGLSGGEKDELESVLSLTHVPAEAYTLVGHVSHEWVALYMRASDVLVMNYPNTPYYRNFMSPMKMFEYMAARRPIVTSDLPAIREILDGDTAVFVKPDDPKSLERGIEKLLNDEQVAFEFAGRAYQKVLQYTWNKRAEKILKFSVV